MAVLRDKKGKFINAHTLREATCLTCTTVFSYYPSTRKGKYCSRDCIPAHPENLPQDVSGEKNPAWKGGKNKCLDCNKQLSNRYSKRCREHASVAMSGKNAPNWKGGTQSIDHLERVKFRKQMQRLVFERDNYRCTMCGEGGDIQVDHIQSWADYVELRFNMENCRTLCMDCHYMVTFGKEKPKNIIWGHNLMKGRVTT